MPQPDVIFDAITANDLDAVRRLLSADPALASARNGDGLSPVLLARYRGRTEALAALLATNPSLDIFEASAVGDSARVRELLDGEPALVNAYAPDGFFPLGLAAYFGHLETATLLLERGADVNAVARNPMRVQALHAAVSNSHRAIIELLVDHGADVNAVQHGGWTPLLGAVHNGQAELVEYLLARGADLTVRIDDGRDAVALADASGHTALAQRLRSVA